MSAYFFIASELGDDLVMDVQGKSKSPGTPINVYGKKSSGTENQLWRKEYVGDNTFRLVSKMGNDVKVTVTVSLLIIYWYSLIIYMTCCGV